MASIIRSVRRFTGFVLRDTGIRLERTGMAMQKDFSYKQDLSRHSTLYKVGSFYPSVSATSFVAPSASLVGRVEVGANSNIWYDAVVRGDVNFVAIGQNTHIGDRTTIHVASGLIDNQPTPTLIGDNVVVEPGAILHACTLQDGCRIGARSIIMDNSVVEAGAIVEAGSVLPGGKTVPKGQVWGGVPAKYIREVTEGEAQATQQTLQDLTELSTEHKALWQ